jgi:hypothetical protein
MKNNVPGSGCINHDCDECVNRRAQPEPAAPTVEPIGFVDPEELKRLAVANGQSIWVESIFVNREYPPAGLVPIYAHPPRTALTKIQILAAYHKFGTGRFEGFEAAVQHLIAASEGKAVTP